MYNDPNQNPYQQNPGQSPYDPTQFNQPLYNANSGTTGQPFQPMYPPPPPNPQSQPPKKNLWSWYKRQKNGTKLGVGCLSIIGVLVLCGMCSAVTSGVTGTKSTQVASTTPQVTLQSTPTTIPTEAPTVKPTATPKPKPTPTPKPTASPAQVEASYKSGTTDTTASAIDKDGNADTGNAVHFTCTIVAFVKDDSGNTAGANVSDPNDDSIIQVIFTPGTDITQLTKGDTLEVWGTDLGVSSGSNAFGATVQESVVQALYMSDTTNGYVTNS